MIYTFSEVLEIHNGKNQRNVENKNGNYPIYGSGGIIGFADKYLCDEPAVIIGRKGSINNPLFVDKPFWNVDTAFALVPNSSLLDVRYLYYFCLSYNFNVLSTTVTIPSLTKFNLLKVKIEVPSLEEQKQIVHKLDKIEMIIGLKERQLKDLEGFIRSRFLELFGDLKLNSKNWKIFSFPEFALIDTQMIHDFHNYEDYPHIGIDSIEKDTGNILAYRTIGEDHVISGKYLFTANHIIYSKIRPNLNKVALPDFDGLCSADAYPILPIEGKSNRYFLAFILRSNLFLSYILAFSNRTNLPKVNKAQIERFRCPLPPIEMQDRFAVFYKQVDKSKYGGTIFLRLLEDIRICCNI